MALHRARDVAQDDELPRALRGAPPDPFGELPARGDVPPHHRPGGEQPAVMVELVAPGPAQLQPGLEQVDEALGVTQLGAGHPVEIAVAEQLARGVRGWSGDDPVDVAAVVIVGRDRYRDSV